MVAISVVLADDPFIRELNRDYRGKDKPTNILSFATSDDTTMQHTSEGEPIHLGDLILAFTTIQKECKAQNKTLAQHVAHLIVHGCLHLIGYDHKNSKDAKTMEDLEIAILRSLGISNPYLINA